MARAAIPGGLSARRAWREARLVERRVETASATTLVLEVTDWPGHLAGQHVDLRLTADDGYTATRSYSLAGPADGDRVEVTVQRVPDGEVSTFLCDDLQVGDTVRLRGPVGGWFVWRPGQPDPVLLVAGGSGVVPLRSMLRHHRAIESMVPVRLLYSAQSLDQVIYRDELMRMAADDEIDIRFTLTRNQPEGWRGYGRRIDQELLAEVAWPLSELPLAYVCGPTGFVEAAASALVALGHEAGRIKTERFGPTGG
jgi:ferredoxin-NADP reductase